MIIDGAAAAAATTTTASQAAFIDQLNEQSAAYIQHPHTASTLTILYTHTHFVVASLSVEARTVANVEPVC